MAMKRMGRPTLPGKSKKKKRRTSWPTSEASQANWRAKKGETISGRLKRGDGGKFTGGDSGASSSDKPKANEAPDTAGEIEKYLDRGEMVGLQALIAGKAPDGKTLDRLMAMGLVTDSGNASSLGKRLAFALKNKDWESALTYAKTARANADGKAKPADSSSQDRGKAKKTGAAPAPKITAATKANLLKVSQGKPVGDGAVELVTLGLIDKNGKLTAKGRQLLSNKKVSEFEAAITELWDKQRKVTAMEEDEKKTSETPNQPASDPVEESWGEMVVPFGAHSFADVIQANQARDIAREINELAYMFPTLVMNVMSDPMAEDKRGAIKALTAEFGSLVDHALAHLDSPDSDGEDGYPEEREKFDEQTISNATSFQEVDPATISDEIVEQVTGQKRDTYAFLEVKAIKPGWGNKRDNNFYPAELFTPDTRKKFIGAKMYETDHDDSKRSTASWVSTIIEDKGVDGTGAPIFRVAIHDPNFAERCRNLQKMNLLHLMECSIQGHGQGRPDFELGGRRGRLIERFNEIYHVDWVTRAGAGGHAVGMAESDTGEETMTEEEKKISEGKTVPTPITENTEQPTPTPAADEKPAPVETPAVTPEPAKLEAKTVADELAKTSLPEAAQQRLGKGSYASLGELQTAITSEIDYLKQVTGSGQPAAMGETLGTGTSAAKLEEVEKAKTDINRRFFGG